MTTEKSKPARIATEFGPDVGKVTGISEGHKLFNFPQDHEYNPKMQGVARFPIYQRMVASDGAMRAIFRSYSLPIVQADWFTDGGRDDIREWVNTWLFRDFKPFLSRACRFLQYGVFSFEQIYGIVNGRTVETSVRPRPPWTWWRPEYTQNGELAGIHQNFGGVFGWVPANRLVLLVNESESEGILGDSLFRSSWKHWDYVDGIEKSDAIGINRAGGGIPWASIKTKDEKTFKAIDTALGDMRTHERARFVYYDDVVSDFGIEWSNYRNDAAIKSLEYHRRLMYTSAVAQFLALGTGNGSYALSADQTEFFLLALRAVATQIAEVINTQRIERCVRLNWADVGPEDMPKIKFGSLDSVGLESLGTYFGQTKDFLTWTPETENHLRQAANLPRLSDDEAAEAIVARAKKAEADAAPQRQMLGAHPASCDCGQHKLQLAGPRAKKWQPWRAKRGVESKVAMLAISNGMDARETQVRAELEATRAAQVRRHTETLRKLLKEKGRNPGIAQDIEPLNVAKYLESMTAHNAGDFDAAAKDVQKELARQERGVDVVEDEMEARDQLQLAAGANPFALPVYEDQKQADLRLIEAKAQQIARDISATVAAAYRRAAMDLLMDDSLSIEQIIVLAEKAAMEAANPTIATGASHAATTPTQMGRDAAGKTFAALGEVSFGIYSALMDGGACEVCVEADGATVDPKNPNPKAPNPQCLGTAARCRCIHIWVRDVKE